MGHLVRCAKCGEAVSEDKTRSTLFEQYRVCIQPCRAPSEGFKRKLEDAAQLTQDYWEGRYYPGMEDREQMVAQDLANMLDDIVRGCK